jgi:multiple sugar transport system permease protein
MRQAQKWLATALGVAAAILAIFPFYWMLRTSVVPSGQLTTTGLSLFPGEIDFSNFVRAWDKAHLGHAVLNGIVVTLGILLLQLLTCIPAAYALAKFRFRGSGLFLGLVIIALLIPT